MRLFLILLVATMGIAAGLAATAFSVGAGATHFIRHFGSWTFSPRIGSPDIDPYARARLFFEGELPLAAGEGYTLRADVDSSGAPLSSRCRYRLESPFPVARYWTITLTDRSGRVLPNLSERFGFTSAEIVRVQGAPFSIEIGPTPISGNWLPTGRNGEPFELALRFYETPLAATATILDARSMPRLTKVGCPA